MSKHLFQKDEQSEINKLKEDNKKLKAELKILKGQQKVTTSIGSLLGNTFSSIFMGRSLKSSLSRLYKELPRNVSKDTMAEISSHVI